MCEHKNASWDLVNRSTYNLQYFPWTKVENQYLIQCYNCSQRQVQLERKIGLVWKSSWETIDVGTCQHPDFGEVQNTFWRIVPKPSVMSLIAKFGFEPTKICEKVLFGFRNCKRCKMQFVCRAKLVSKQKGETCVVEIVEWENIFCSKHYT